MASNFIASIMRLKIAISDIRASISRLQSEVDSPRNAGSDESESHLADERAGLAKMEARLQKAMQLLFQKDSATHAALEKALDDEASTLSLQIHALKIRIMSKLTERRMESDHLERTALRAKSRHKGVLELDHYLQH
jgi:hypothetical protein